MDIEKNNKQWKKKVRNYRGTYSKDMLSNKIHDNEYKIKLQDYFAGSHWVLFLMIKIVI